jgi:hypothetical protein
LYCQFSEADQRDFIDWQESAQLAAAFTKPKRSQGLIDGGAHVYKKSISGERKNVDILV